MIDLEKDLNQNYEILSLQRESSNSRSEAVLRLTPQDNWVYFQGHFPAMPVLPGVAVADISQFFIEKYIFQSPAVLKKISFFKLRSPVRPGQSLMLHIQSQNEKTFEVLWKDDADQNICAEMLLEFQ